MHKRTEDIRKVYHCIGLLNSMVRGGERHSDTSVRITVEALEATERLEEQKYDNEQEQQEEAT